MTCADSSNPEDRRPPRARAVCPRGPGKYVFLYEEGEQPSFLLRDRGGRGREGGMGNGAGGERAKEELDTFSGFISCSDQDQANSSLHPSLFK